MTTTSTSSTPEPLLDLQRLVAGTLWRRRIWVSVGLLGLLAGALLAVLVPLPPTAVARLLIVHESDQESVSASLLETDLTLLETTQIAAAALEWINADERPENFLTSYTGRGPDGQCARADGPRIERPQCGRPRPGAGRGLHRRPRPADRGRGHRGGPGPD